MFKIDKIDRKIVDLLMADGRMPAADIARKIGNISERVIRYRIDRLVKEGIILIKAIPKPLALGYSVVADVFIEVEPGLITEVATHLKDFECVSYVACAIGETDVSAQVVAHNTDEIYRFVTEVIGRMPGVRKTTTSIVPIVIKDVYQWRIPSSGCVNGKDSDFRR
ncbi:MAG TPA: Lrp/AsnC family transcriptional regulator [Anaerolineales bacterium]|nr:Lrp/AsnC family transcriptional regulator [Anaerolineales bacterium]